MFSPSLVFVVADGGSEDYLRGGCAGQQERIAGGRAFGKKWLVLRF